jgi:protein-S-isoprenylcysteine O-methyltransferase Ste14
MKEFVQIIFWIDVGVVYFLIFGAIWSIAIPEKRVWPPPGKQSWQYRLTWLCFYLVFLINAILFVLDWNLLGNKGFARLFVGVPLIILGGLLVSWGIVTLGVKNTSGLRDGIVKTGPYRFTRNPQYLGDILLFIGLSVVSNSWMLWVTHILISILFLMVPLTEEPWLEAIYGEEYLQYKKSTSRFL